MRETEVKAKIEDTEKIIKALEALGCVFGDPIQQTDVIYWQPEFNERTGHKRNILRVRSQNGKFLLTLKRDITNEMDCMEKEVEISEGKTMSDIIQLLDYVEYARVKKSRRKTKYEGREICVDEVEGLGSFIEMESLVEDGQESTAQSEMFEFLKSLGVKEENRMSKGYDTLMHNFAESQKETK